MRTAQYRIARAHNGINDVNVFGEDIGNHVLGYVWPNGGNTYTQVSPPDYWASINNGYTPWERGVRYLDVNGDGLPDIVHGYYNYTTGTSTNAMYLNTYTPSSGYGHLRVGPGRES